MTAGFRLSLATRGSLLAYASRIRAKPPGSLLRGPCLDWTERRLHVAGPLGRQLLTHALERGWMQRRAHKRGLTLTAPGRMALEQILGLQASQIAQEADHV